MLPLLLKLLNQLHKKAVQLGKGKNYTVRTHKRLSKGLTLS
jgi:hypothetical protein